MCAVSVLAFIGSLATKELVAVSQLSRVVVNQLSPETSCEKLRAERYAGSCAPRCRPPQEGPPKRKARSPRWSRRSTQFCILTLAFSRALARRVAFCVDRLDQPLFSMTYAWTTAWTMPGPLPGPRFVCTRALSSRFRKYGECGPGGALRGPPRASEGQVIRAGARRRQSRARAMGRGPSSASRPGRRRHICGPASRRRPAGERQRSQERRP